MITGRSCLDFNSTGKGPSRYYLLSWASCLKVMQSVCSCVSEIKKPVVDTMAKCTGKTKSETRDFCNPAWLLLLNSPASRQPGCQKWDHCHLRWERNWERIYFCKNIDFEFLLLLCIENIDGVLPVPDAVFSWLQARRCAVPPARNRL